MLNAKVLRHRASFIALAVSVCATQAFAQTDDSQGEARESDIIVTGVLGPRAIEKAPISITAVTKEQIDQQALTSAADLLRTVPGVYVNNAFGEIRNVVFSRGVSAYSLDGAGGYYYVSLQEDGLPVEPILAGNFGPDYFSRPDIMLSRLEALRGGTAAITGPNAPGGIFNYISKTGKSDPGVELRAKLGLEGNGKNPFYRGDAYAGGEIGNGLYYAVGGFYRHSTGARDPGYARNRGGQVRANLLWDYGSGSLKVTAKYLNDRNGFDEFLPAVNFRNPRLARPYSNTSTTLPDGGAREYTRLDGSTGDWDPADAVHSRAIGFSAEWEHEIASDWTISNRAGYSRNKSDWDVGAVITTAPLTDVFTHILTGTAGVPGTLTLRRPDGSLAATVNSATGFDYTVTANNLPNQNILANGVQTLIGISPTFRGENFQDTLSINGKVGNHNLAIGTYIQLGRLKATSDVAGGALLTQEPDPQFLNATFQTPLAPGATFQVTGPGGFANNGLFGGGDEFNGTQRSISVFAGDSWEVTDRLTIEAGIRYEKIKYNVRNVTLTNPASPFGLVGPDGDPFTLYDNGLATVGAPTRVKRSYDFFNYTGSVAYDFTNSFTAYARYTKGKKAPILGIIQGIDDLTEIATLFPDPQTIEQVELGLKYNRPGISIQMFPFYSKLSNVADGQSFIDETGAAYSPPPVFGKIRTYGVEIQSNMQFGRFNWYSAVTIQDAKASGFSTYIQNGPPRADDELVVIPSGDADNNPKLIVRTTGTIDLTDKFQVFATYSYLGRRAANRLNAFYLPGFSTVDLGASWTVGAVKLQANINNFLNNYGIMSYSRAGGIQQTLDRQGLTPEAVAASGSTGLFQVIPSQPRSFWLSAAVKF